MRTRIQSALALFGMAAATAATTTTRPPIHLRALSQHRQVKETETAGRQKEQDEDNEETAGRQKEQDEDNEDRAGRQKEQDEDNEDRAEILLQFSIWVPEIESEIELRNVMENARSDILDALQTVLCLEANNLLLVSESLVQTLDLDDLPEYDECPKHRTFSAQDSSFSILQSPPNIKYHINTYRELIWATYQARYTVVDMGSLYIDEAVMNQPNLPITQIREVSVGTMEDVLQLNLNIQIMEGEFDHLLRTNVPRFRSYASPLNEEPTRFNLARIDYETNIIFSPRIFCK